MSMRFPKEEECVGESGRRIICICVHASEISTIGLRVPKYTPLPVGVRYVLALADLCGVQVRLRSTRVECVLVPLNLLARAEDGSV